ncbi:MAG: translocation/assembly module TamB domain-containing protein [Cryomorphaceae bacterium]|nr:translocation/assembly module TamB domain-containing protein [Cryomorphaceae bacterium]
MFLWIFAVIFVLLASIVIAIRTPFVQQKITNYATKYLSDKTGGHFAIDKLYLRFDFDLQIEGLEVDDPDAERLLALQSLRVGVKWRPLLKRHIELTPLNIDNLYANVAQLDAETFSFSFITNAFAANDTLDLDTVDHSKDETSSPWTFAFSPVELKNIDLTYSDYMGCLYALTFDRLHIDPKVIDWEKNVYTLKELLLVNPQIRAVICSTPDKEDEESDDAPIPVIGVNKLSITQLAVDFDSENISINLPSLDIFLREVSIEHKNVQLDLLALEKLDVTVKLRNDDDIDNDVDVDNDVDNDVDEGKVAKAMGLPDWRLDVNALRINASNIAIDTILHMQSLNWDLGDIHYNGDPNNPVASVHQKELRFQSNNDIPSINDCRFVLNVSDHSIDLSQFHLAALSNQIDLSASLKYDRLQAFIDDPMNVNWVLNLQSNDLYPDGLSQLVDIQDVPPFIRTRRWKTQIEAHGEGIDLISLQQLNLSHPEGFDLQMSGKASSPTEPEKLNAEWSLNRLDVKGQIMRDVKSAYAHDEVNFPKYITLNSKGQYSHEAIAGHIHLNSNIARFNGKVQTILGMHRIDGNLTADGLVFGDNHLDNLSAHIFAGTSSDPLANSDMKFTLNTARLNDIDLEEINITANVLQRQFNLKMTSDDPNASLALDATGRVDTIDFSTQFDLHVRDFRPHAFSLMEDVIDIQTKLKGQVQFTSTESFDIRVDFDTIGLQKNKQRIDYNNIYVSVQSRPDRFALDADLKDIQMTLSSNKAIDALVTDIDEYVSYIIGRKDTLQKSNTELSATVNVKSGLILDFLGDGYSFGQDTLEITALYRRSPKAKVSLNFYAPEISTPDLQLGDFTLLASGDEEELQASLEFNDLNVRDFNLGRTRLNAGLSRESTHFDLANWNNEALLYRIKTQNKISKDSIRVHIVHDSLVLNGAYWNIEPDNQLLIDNKVKAENWTMRYNGSSFSIKSDEREDRRTLSLLFNEFSLTDLSAILNPETPPVDGFINGELRHEWLETSTTTLADINIDSIRVLSHDIGNLSILAEHGEKQDVAVDIRLEGPHIELLVDGFYGIYEDLPDYDLGVELKRLDLEILEAFGKGILRETTGHLRLTAILQGQGSDFTYNGSLRFIDAGFNIAAINTPFTLSDERISVKDKRINFESFTMKDASKNPLTVNGEILISDNPMLDIIIDAKRFRLLGSSRKDNDLFFGDLLLDANIKIGGLAKEPIIDMSAKLLEGTNITFIVPESEADVMDRRSVVSIVDRSIPDSLRAEVKPLSTLAMGLYLDANLKADPSTTFNVIIDEQAGDRLEVSGEADLSLQIDPSGAMQLSGMYNITEGSYRLNFYDLVRRKFELTPGSSIRWSGDPLMAEMDLKAVYRLRTSPLELMVDQIGPNRELQQPYRREQPFEVVMNIEGELLQPSLSFDLDMPENARGAVNGAIYSRIQQLRQDENELNQQTFALIVLNQFVPTGRGAGGPGTGEMARSSASRLISQQLNQLSGRYIKGLDVELGLDSYTDHEEGQDRTDLNVRVGRTFLDDRLTVQAGGQFELEGGNRSAEGNNPNQFMGDVNIEYTLTEDGRYRLRAFRRNDWQGAVEGQVITTGASIIFKREFDTFEELVRAIWKRKPDEDND